MTSQLNSAARAAIIETLTTTLNENYIFPEMARQMQAHLCGQHTAGAYDALTDVHAFAEALTRDVQAISRDGHLRVRFDPQMAEAINSRAERRQPTRDEVDAFIREQRFNNFGFEKVERLPGNIGYLALTGFLPAELGGETAVAAMNFLANSSALIIDLRRNNGGAPSMIQLITSYLFDEQVRHLNSFYMRPLDSTQQFWTLPHVPGRRMPDVPVYVLTSHRTFSAAEEFTYNLKAMERATIVGETTGGGAHPQNPMALVEGYIVTVPIGRAINPITNSNWEGTGIAPHIAVPEDDALMTAHLHALAQLIATTEDSALRRQLEWDLEIARASYQPVLLDEAALRRFVGTYRTGSVLLENGALYYQDTRQKSRLTALTPESFLFPNPFMKVRFEINSGERAASLTLTNTRDWQAVTAPRLSE